jgi:carbonic anhydrase
MKSTSRYSLSAIVFLALTCPAFASGSGPGISPDEAIKKLADGNSRYAAGTCLHSGINQARRTETAQKGQKPFATILSCSDSRVPPEYVFDQGIGDLFVIRVAGNVADTDETGSAEYGVDHLGTPVLMVLGHSTCGAVTAVATGAVVHGSIPALVENIKPAVDKAKKNNPSAQGDALVSSAITLNVWQSIEDLLKKSAMIRARAKSGEVKIVGALYDIETGRISVLGPHPQEQLLLAAPESAAGNH